MLLTSSFYNKNDNTSRQISRSFFAQDTLIVAEGLIGQNLIRIDDHSRLVGRITEVEAYRGENDLGCHARAGRTARTEIMYGTPGFAYVYFTYGMHWMLNIVCEAEGFPAAVLLRSVEVLEGLEIITRRRMNRHAKYLTNGPAKICQAFNIDKHLNGYDLCQDNAELYLEWNRTMNPNTISVKKTARVGLFSVPEPWKSIPWRFVAGE